MREIKFRAWDSYTKRFYFWGINLENGKNFTSPPSRDGWVFENDQFTGLKDTNDIDIYEGDILGSKNTLKYKKDGTLDRRLKVNEPEYLDIQEVKWGIHNDFAHGWDYESGKFAGWSFDPKELELSNPLVVIGNIWENKELLK